METHEFDISIQPDGKVRIHVKGAKGPACQEYVKLFEEILNAEGQVEHTNEFYEPPTDVSIHIDQRTET
ncbi:DUF2997 domain-containing protein [Planctomycetota bacterium]